MKPKAKVDIIFRPLRGYRSSTAGHSSIFRRSNSSSNGNNNNNKQQLLPPPPPLQQQQQEQQLYTQPPIMEFQECIINSSDTSESYIISSSDYAATNGPWPHNPHLNNLTTTLSSHSAATSTSILGDSNDEQVKQKQQQQQQEKKKKKKKTQEHNHHYRQLDRSNPLPTTLGTSSSSSNSSTTNEDVGGDDKNNSFFSSSDEKNERINKVAEAGRPTPPSYYKIELVPRSTTTVGSSSNNNNCNIDECSHNSSKQEESTTVIVLTSGDDASVQLTPSHNNQLRLASTINTTTNANHDDNDDDDDNDDYNHSRLFRSRGIILATPIVEEDGIEHEASYQTHQKWQKQRPKQVLLLNQQESPPQRWTISKNCEIIAMPPSPSSVSMTHFFKKPRGGGGDGASDFNVKSSFTNMPLPPPMLVKANSSSSSSSSSSSCSNSSNPSTYVNGKNSMEHDFHILQQSKQLSSPPLPAATRNSGDGGNHSNTTDLMLSKSLATISLESPPRMTRSIISQSLFQESVSSCEEESGNGGGGSDGKRMSPITSGSTSINTASGGQTMNGGTANHKSGCGGGGRGGGCGLRFDFLSRILDVFSLSGGCCHHNVGGEGGLCSYDGDNNSTAVKKTMCA